MNVNTKVVCFRTKEMDDKKFKNQAEPLRASVIPSFF